MTYLSPREAVEDTEVRERMRIACDHIAHIQARLVALTGRPVSLERVMTGVREAVAQVDARQLAEAKARDVVPLATVRALTKR